MRTARPAGGSPARRRAGGVAELGGALRGRDGGRGGGRHEILGGLDRSGCWSGAGDPGGRPVLLARGAAPHRQDTLADRDHRADREQPERDVEGVGHTEPREADTGEPEDQPLGALDEAAVAAQACGLGAGLDVGDQLPGDEAGEREAREQRAVGGEGPPRDGRELGAVDAGGRRRSRARHRRGCSPRAPGGPWRRRGRRASRRPTPPATPRTGVRWG